MVFLEDIDRPKRLWNLAVIVQFNKVYSYHIYDCNKTFKHSYPN